MNNELKDAGSAVSLIRGDLLFRLQRRVGLIPERGLGMVRRAVFWALLAWLPTAVWAGLNGGLLPAEGSEPLLAHFGINVRLLVAVPLLIFAEGMVESTLSAILPRLVSSGIVAPERRERLSAALQSVARLRDAVHPWIVMAALLGTVLLVTLPGAGHHEFQWVKGQPAGTGFGVWWYLYVGRMIFLALLLAWLWRALLLLILFRRIVGVGLSLVPTHPDRCAGLGFMARIPVMFAPVVLAVSSVFAAGWAHQMVYHEATFAGLRTEMIGLVVGAPLVFLMPFVAFFGLLARTKKQGLLDYGELIGRHGRLVRERWIECKPIADAPILEAPELGPIADTAAAYDLIAKIRPLPLNMGSVVPLVGATALPMFVLAVLQLPLKTVLQVLMKIVV